MNTKLTLSIEESVIERAKAYAKKQNRSLSAIIENYLDAITSDNLVKEDEVSPLVKSMTGIIPEERDYKKEYRDYLEKKQS